MASSLGGLIVTLGLDAAQYIQGLTKAELQAKTFADKLEKGVEKSAKLARQSIVAIGTAAVGAALAVDQLVKQAGKFQDMEEKTGASAEALASFSVAAGVAGVEVGDVATAMNKMAKNLSGVDDESKAAGAALQSLGFNVASFKKLAPEKQMEALAKAFTAFADSPEKSAAAMALFGKAGAELLPFFNELAGATGRQKILTAEQIKQADDYADAQARLVGQIKLYAQAVAIEMIPAFNDIIKAAKETIEQFIGVTDATDKLTRDQKIKEFGKDAADAARTTALAFGTLAESVIFLVRAARAFTGSVEVMAADIKALGALSLIVTAKTPAGALISKEALDESKKALADRNRILEEANKRYADLIDVNATDFTDRIRAQMAEAARPPPEVERSIAFWDKQSRDRERQDKARRPTLPFKGAVDKDKAQQEAKKILEVQLKEQERGIRLEQELLRDKEHYLQGSFEDELIGFREFYARKQTLVETAEGKILDAQKRQIELAKAYAARPGLDTAEQLAAKERVAALEDERASTERDFARQRADNERAATRALRDYGDAVDELNAQMLDLAGNTEMAAAVRFDKQNRSLQKAFEFEGNTGAQNQLKNARDQEIARAGLTKAMQRYQFVVQDVALAEGRIALEQQSGALTSLEAINKRAAVAREYIVLLEQQANAAEKAAMAMVAGPSRDAALQDVRRLRLEIDHLAESARELENTFRKTFEDAFANSLVSVIDGTRSLSEAIKDMERQIVASISRIAAQNIGEALFGKSGPMGSGGFDIAGWLAKAFGGGGGGGFSLEKVIGSMFGEGFAAGGLVSANRAVLVGERGPELFQPRAAGNIVPNSELMSRRAQRQGDINISINVDGSTSRATADQIAVRTGRAVRRAMNRNA